MEERFLKGAFLLLLGSGLSRVLGAVYRIFLPYVMGSEGQLGMGLYGMAYPIYTLTAGISTAGVPLALSKLISHRLAVGRPDEAARLFRLGLLLLAGLGFLLGASLYGIAPWLAREVFHDPRVAWSLRAVAPAAFLASLVAAYRGYFQGLQEMGPHALSQVVEQFFRIAAMFVLAAALLPLGIHLAAAGASFGATVGAAAALLYLVVRRRHAGAVPLRRAAAAPAAMAVRAAPSDPAASAALPSPPGEAGRTELRELIQYSLPIFLAGMVAPLMNVADSLIVPGRLHAAGFDVDQATTMFGWLTGFAQPFTIVPTVFTVALATALLPAIAEADALRHRQQVAERVHLGVRLTFLLGLPSAAGLWLLSSAIPDLFYGLPEVGPILAVLALSVPFMTVQQTTASILQGLGMPEAPMRHLLAGLVCKVALTWVLAGVPAWNVQGAAAATAAAYLAAAALNLRSIARRLPGVLQWPQIVGRPLAATALMGVMVAGFMQFLPPLLGLKAATVCAVLIGAVGYGTASIWVKAVGPEDWTPLLAKVRGWGRERGRKA